MPSTLAARAMIFLGLGRPQTCQGNRTEARHTLDKALTAAIAAKPDANGFFPRLVFEVGMAQAKNGDTAVSQLTFDRAIPLIQSLPLVEQDQQWVLLLAIEQRCGNREATRATIEAYRRFLSTATADPRSPSRFVLSWGGLLHVGGFSPAARMVATQAMSGDFLGAFREVENAAAFRDPQEPAARYQALIGIAQALRPEDGPLIRETLAKIKTALLAATPPWPRWGVAAAQSLINQAILGLMDVEAQLGLSDDALALATRHAPPPRLLVWPRWEPSRARPGVDRGRVWPDGGG